MQHKQLAALGLSLALTASLPVAALAAENDLLISPAPSAYPYSITVNGTALDTSALPNVDGLPVRLVAEADHGSAHWYPEENSGMFYFSGNSATVNFADCTVSLGDSTAEGVTATVVDGVTFLPVSFFQAAEGVTVTVNDETGTVDIVTPNNDSLVKLAYELSDIGGLFGMKHGVAEMEQYFQIPADCFADGRAVGFFPMVTSPDTIVLGKVADGKLDALKEALETYRKTQEGTFSWYLSQNLPKVQDARVEIEGDCLLFYIGENADQVVSAFHAAVKEA